MRPGAAARSHVDLDHVGGFDQPRGGVDEARKVVASIEQAASNMADSGGSAKGAFNLQLQDAQGLQQASLP